MSLSVCMIVRDEEAMLPDCLALASSQARAAGLSVELVVLDTGSTDRTVELARAAGAQVHSFAWRDDFAAARNESLRHCTGDWVLVLDADERTSPELWRALAALLEDPGAGAATVPLRNAQTHGHARVARLLRVFRRDPAITFRHAIHEDASESVHGYLARTGRRLVALEGVIEHLGYVRAHAESRGKRERDQRLLEAQLERDPDDLYSHFKLLELARFWGDQVLSGIASDAAHAALARAVSYDGMPWAGELAVLIANARWARRPAEALDFLDRLRPQLLPSAALQLRRGELLELLGELQASRDAFAACAALDSGLGDRQLTTVRPRMGLCRLAWAQGRLYEALSWAKGALELSPLDPEAQLACAALAQALAR